MSTVSHSGNVVRCDCGGQWNKRDIADYSHHLNDGRHQRAMKVSVCINCFYDQHTLCEGRRSPEWRCQCDHQASFKRMFDKDADGCAEAFGDFIRAGAPHRGHEDSLKMRNSERKTVLDHLNALYRQPAHVK